MGVYTIHAQHVNSLKQIEMNIELERLRAHNLNKEFEMNMELEKVRGHNLDKEIDLIKLKKESN